MNSIPTPSWLQYWYSINMEFITSFYSKINWILCHFSKSCLKINCLNYYNFNKKSVLLTHSLLSDKGCTIQSGDNFKQNFKGRCWILLLTTNANSYDASIAKSEPIAFTSLSTILWKYGKKSIHKFENKTSI